MKKYWKDLKSIVNKYGFVLLPVVISLYPLVSFYGANIDDLRAGSFNIFTFVIFNLVIGALAWAGSLVVTRNLRKASILSVVPIVLFFTLGRLHSGLEGFEVKTPLVDFGPTKILLVLAVAAVGGAWLYVWKLPKEKAPKLVSSLLLVASVLMLSALLPILLNFASGGSSNSNSKQTAAQNGKIKPADLPDIYYILLDGHARQDIMESNFGSKDTSFVDGLRDKGFYVADKSNSNYAHTHLSVPSTFNMKYLNYLSKEVGEESTNRRPLRDLLNKNEVVPKFQSLGYKYIQIGSQWSWTETSPYSDIVVPGDNNEKKILGIKLDELTLVYMQTTAVKPWVKGDIVGGIAGKILTAFKQTEKVPEYKDPTLTFTHINSPHPPFLFDRDGNIDQKASLGMNTPGYSDEAKFADQTYFIDQITSKLIDKILKDSDKPPIIIVASDHGPASSLGRKDFEETDPAKLDKHGIQERMASLNAFYFPDKDYSRLYPEISPVNNFRVILSQYFGQKLDLLEDKSYFSDNLYNEYRMTDVTDITRMAPQ